MKIKTEHHEDSQKLSDSKSHSKEKQPETTKTSIHSIMFDSQRKTKWESKAIGGTDLSKEIKPAASFKPYSDPSGDLDPAKRKANAKSKAVHSLSPLSLATFYLILATPFVLLLLWQKLTVHEQSLAFLFPGSSSKKASSSTVWLSLRIKQIVFSWHSQGRKWFKIGRFNAGSGRPRLAFNNTTLKEVMRVLCSVVADVVVFSFFFEADDVEKGGNFLAFENHIDRKLCMLESAQNYSWSVRHKLCKWLFLTERESHWKKINKMSIALANPLLARSASLTSMHMSSITRRRKERACITLILNCIGVAPYAWLASLIMRTILELSSLSITWLPYARRTFPLLAYVRSKIDSTLGKGSRSHIPYVTNSSSFFR